MIPPNLAILFLGVVGATAAAAPTPDPPPWAAGFSPGSILQKLVDEAVASGASSAALPPGNFSFGATPFAIRGAVNLTVLGAGVDRCVLISCKQPLIPSAAAVTSQTEIARRSALALSWVTSLMDCISKAGRRPCNHLQSWI